MDDKDRVFARFKDDKPETSDRRELLTIPRRAGSTGSRVVEVVHVRSRRGDQGEAPARRCARSCSILGWRLPDEQDGPSINVD